MRSPPILSDTEAEALADQSRADGATLVRHHLENHMRHNPGRASDYVTVRLWRAKCCYCIERQIIIFSHTTIFARKTVDRYPSP